MVKKQLRKFLVPLFLVAWAIGSLLIAEWYFERNPEKLESFVRHHEKTEELRNVWMGIGLLIVIGQVYFWYRKK